MKKFYIYRHIRLDKNEVFYVGLGKKNIKGGTFERVYLRAFSKKKGCRNLYWFNIINKTSYLVEILFETDDVEKIRKKEIEFIKLYGRKDLNKGTLVNFCDGGEGVLNWSEESKRKKLESWLRVTRTGAANCKSKEVFVYLTNGVFYGKFESRSLAAKSLDVNVSDIRKVLIGKIQRTSSFIFKERYEGEKIDVHLKSHSKLRIIECYDLDMNFIRDFPSTHAAARFVGAASSNICKACRNTKFYCKGYRFKYKNS